MYNRVSINKVLSSKPIYSTCFSGLNVFKCLKNVVELILLDKRCLEIHKDYVKCHMCK